MNLRIQQLVEHHANELAVAKNMHQACIAYDPLSVLNVTHIDCTVTASPQT